MKSKLLGLIVASLLLVLTTHARAATINIDLTGLFTTVPYQPGCYCAPEPIYISPIFNLPAGNTYNFGTVSFPWLPTGITPDEGPFQQTGYFTGGFASGGQVYGPGGLYFCGDNGPGLAPTPCNPPTPLSVALVLPNGGGFQVEFWGADYLAPAPLPDSVPLFATGLAAVALFGWHRKRKTSAAIAA